MDDIAKIMVTRELVEKHVRELVALGLPTSTLATELVTQATCIMIKLPGGTGALGGGPFLEHCARGYSKGRRRSEDSGERPAIHVQRDGVACGLAATPADKEKAVKALLASEKWRGMSDREIALAANVTHPFVSKQRKSTISVGNVSTSSAPRMETRLGKDGKRYPATRAVYARSV